MEDKVAKADEADIDDRTVFVRNLPYTVTDAQVQIVLKLVFHCNPHHPTPINVSSMHFIHWVRAREFQTLTSCGAPCSSKTFSVK